MPQILSNHTFIIYGGEHYNPLGMVRSLGEEGIKSIVIIDEHKQKVTSASRYIGELYFVHSLEEGYNLIINKWGNEPYKPFILTSSDDATSFYDQKYNDIQDKFLFYNAGEQGRITYFMEKERLCLLAEKHGLMIPKTYKVNKGEIPKNLQYPVLTKADNSLIANWKSATHICENEEQLKDAFKNIVQSKVIIQHYIKKKNELCLDGYSWNHGKNVFVGIASNYKYILPDCYSFYMDIFNFHNEKIQKALEGMMSEIGFEGIFSVEFLVDENEQLYFLEINFRNSTWSYASTKAGMNLVTGWCCAMVEGESHNPVYQDIPSNFTAMVELSDFKARVTSKKIGIGQWIKEFRDCNCTFYYDKKDKRPLWTAITSKLF